ncbi:MAG: pyridoxamine 5'-phosphate oxidase [Verrucomicrobia bacterium]|nr:pyridoxamine 5'-phosphate oxidase [Verrucomicrobiota bacterium]
MSTNPIKPQPVDDPFICFNQWFAQAQATGMDLPNAMTLASVDPTGRPSARIVLMKQFDEGGLVFFTNYASRKGRELARNPAVALVFWWKELGLQVRIEGELGRVSTAESEAYFNSRPRGYRLGAWASHQSRAIAGKQTLRQAFKKYQAAFKGKPVPRPPTWGGYRVTPQRFEFWTNRDNRLHDRVEYNRSKSGRWTRRQLAP